jgi:hypothetical protein
MSKKKERTPEEKAERWARRVEEMKKLQAEGKLSKVGEWMISEEGMAGLWTIADMKAVMK